VLSEPGQPKLDIWPSFRREWHTSLDESGPECCNIGIWSSFTHGGRVLVQPHNNYRVSTWGEGHNYHGGEFHENEPCPHLGE
jgi:hypothetical protein